jgi:hypothetical protein
VGGAAFTLTVNGSNFVTNSVVQWNGVSRTTTYVNNTQMTAAIAAGDLTNPSSNIPVSVTTPGPGGGNSNTLPVAVEYPLPAISSVSPSQVILGTGAFTLTVNGSNFVNGATVYWNRVSRVTQYVSSIQVTATILASDIQSGTSQGSVTVQNPSPSAGISNIASVVLATPAPQITSISPTTGVAGAYNAVMITGSGFVQGSMVQLETQSLYAIFQSPTSLQLSISTTVGPVNLTVVNPAPSAGSSNTVIFTGTAAGPGVQLTVGNVDSSGNVLEGGMSQALSSTGRYFAFYDSYANGHIRDTCLTGPAGCKASTVTFPTNPQYPVYGIEASGISSSGRYVSFNGIQKYAPSDLYFIDSCGGTTSGCTPSTNYIGPGEFDVFTPAMYMTPSGRYVTYFGNIYDSCVGAAPGCTPTSIAVPTAVTPHSSADARYVVYSNSTNIVLHDTCLGAAPGCAVSDTDVAALPASCASASATIGPTISSDAAYIAWGCSSSAYQQGTVYKQATCLSARPGCIKTPGLITSVANYLSSLWVSDGGRFVFYEGGTYLNQSSSALSLVYVYDTCNGAASGCVPQAVPVSADSTGAVANSDCGLAAISTDGKYVLFNSNATNLVTLPAKVTDLDYIALNPLF